MFGFRKFVCMYDPLVCFEVTCLDDAVFVKESGFLSDPAVDILQSIDQSFLSFLIIEINWVLFVMDYTHRQSVKWKF